MEIQGQLRRAFLAIAVAVFASVAEQASGNGILTLEVALAAGLAQSPEIARAHAAFDESSWRRFQALGAGFLPKVSISGQHFFDAKYSLTSVAFGAGGAPISFPGFYPNTQLALEVQMPIFDGLANVRQYQAASLYENAAQQELRHAEFQLVEDIRLAFYQALAASLLDQVAETNVRTLEDHLKQVQIRRQGGAATKYDSLRVEVQLNEARADAIDVKDNVSLTRKKLNVLLGREEDDRQVQGTLPIPDSKQVATLELGNAVRERSDIEAMSLRAQAADKMKSASNAWLVPSVSVGGQYQVYESQLVGQTVTNTGKFDTAYNVGVFLKWNLFDGGSALAQANQAYYRAVQSDRSAQIARLKVPYDFAYWKRRYVANTDHYRSKQLDIARSEESVRLAKEEERAGSRTSTETLDAELDLFRAKAGVVSAQVNAAEAQIRLELALGRKI